MHLLIRQNCSDSVWRSDQILDWSWRSDWKHVVT